MWFDQPRKRNAPLAGLKVLELARVLAGPWAGQMLADLGADVIKVESPDGDNTRIWGPPWVEHNGETTSAYYHACNRGKRSLVADLKDAGQCAAIRALGEDADVIIENFKPGALKKYGLDYEGVRAANANVIYCSVTGFGQDGPRRSEPGYDYVIQGMSGLMALNGEPDGDPVKFGVSISDLTCGLYSANAIQAALLMRERTGKGQWIDMSLLDCSTALLANQAASYFASGANPPRMGNAHAQVAPYGVFPTSEGHVILAPANERLFAKLITVLERDDLAGDPRFDSNGGRVTNAEILNAEIAKATAQWSKADLLESCARAGIPAGPINNLDEVFADPQVVARGMQIDLDGMTGVRSPFVFSDADLALDRPSPTLGEHNPKD